MKRMVENLFRVFALLWILWFADPTFGQADVDRSAEESTPGQSLYFSFDNTLSSHHQRGALEVKRGSVGFGKGLEGKALDFSEGAIQSAIVSLDDLSIGRKKDFTVQFWVRTTSRSKHPFPLLGSKEYLSNRLADQKKKGWVFFVRDGTWAWNIGAGGRRLTYQRSNGQFMPINDGRWHQLVMTFDHNESLVRLYFDGVNVATYWVGGPNSFDFSNRNQIYLGLPRIPAEAEANGLQEMRRGAKRLQEIVDHYNGLSIGALQAEDFISLVIRPEKFINKKLSELGSEKGTAADDLAARGAKAVRKIKEISRRLMRSKYTVHQNGYYMEVAWLSKLYHLVGRKVVIRNNFRDELLRTETFSSPDFSIDNLKIQQQLLSDKQVAASYSKVFPSRVRPLPKRRESLTVGAWNIYHGGIHKTLERDGWDSRDVIIDLIRREKIDVLMMQETYSSGDHIAAELGYYFATTVDWDNMSQGSNISVLSRFPIKSISVPPKSAFMSVAAKVAVSESQDIYAISSWFGMRNFPDVFKFHKSKFSGTDDIPVVIGGDFNAVPHTDGGRSLASETLLKNGFRDAYRDLYPNAKTHPGPTHRSGRRIDQIYYKGKQLTNRGTTVYSKWPTGFPSDHYLIKTLFRWNDRAKK